jgi:hypothetical protein
MKSQKTNQPPAAPPPKGKVKIKNLKLIKETLENLSDGDAAAVKGGGITTACGGSIHK